MRAKADFIFLGILGALIVNAIINAVVFNYQLSINNYFGFICWLLALLLRILNFRFNRYCVGCLIILGTLNILNFGIGTAVISFSVGNIYDVKADGLGLNPIILFILIVYCFVNKKVINVIISELWNGSAKEQEDARQKNINFYLKKFEHCSADELECLLKKLNDYPVEAQIAIKKLTEQQKTSGYM